MDLPRVVKPFNWSVPLSPPWKQLEWVILWGTKEICNWWQQKSLPNSYVYGSLHSVFSLSAQCLQKPAQSLHYSSCAYLATTTKLAYDQKKCARRTASHTFMLVCINSADSLHQSASSLHQVCIFTNHLLFPGQPVVRLQTRCRTRADFADFVQTRCTL